MTKAFRDHCDENIVQQRGPALAGAGPNARAGRGAQCKTQARGPLSSDFCDVIVFNQPCYDRGRAQMKSTNTRIEHIC